MGVMRTAGRTDQWLNTDQDVDSRVARDTAIALRVRNLRRNEFRLRARHGDRPLEISANYLPLLERTTCSDRDGSEADIICWNGSPGEVWVWKVAHDDPSGRRLGAAALDRHIDAVRADPRAAGKRVVHGPASAFVPATDVGQQIGSPRNAVKVDTLEAGVEVYQVRRYRSRLAVPRANREVLEEAIELMEEVEDWERDHERRLCGLPHVHHLPLDWPGRPPRPIPR
ncbi:hypothetical protein ADL15_00295 [Actinoplanes awajinensis subsp. mycoplanecinus]|uniref:Uncharacterized protein n=2 Tax=Actinoplanes awajinensis TaxID=135946 RepID=A0A0X3VG58_9ACTN|nr:hypothetical protein ADL15_00295 [Actinoplanes awajinensis subsp. mycoplanecinus]